MNWSKEWSVLIGMLAAFLACFYLPIGLPRFDNAVMESLHLLNWYAREHVLLSLLPAFFIAGAVAVFVSQASVMKYLGANAPKLLAYGVASVSGSILTVCSCTVLPLFTGIYRMGAGLGPATAFLYSGPAINVLAIILTARVLGLQLGIARAVGAVTFSIVIGLLMHFIFRKEEAKKTKLTALPPEMEEKRPLWENGLYFVSMILILVFANWGKSDQSEGIWHFIYTWKWIFTAGAALGLELFLITCIGMYCWKILLTVILIGGSARLFPHTPLIPFSIGILGLSIITATGHEKMKSWFSATWGLTRQILPLLFFGVLVVGLLLGRPGEEGLIPSQWVASLVGGNSLGANFFASIFGAFTYFATLTEVPILQGLIGNGMGQGPALALLLAGPALSLPNMLVIRSVLGLKKTVVFVLLVVVMATFSGMFFGLLVA